VICPLRRMVPRAFRPPNRIRWRSSVACKRPIAGCLCAYPGITSPLPRVPRHLKSILVCCVWKALQTKTIGSDCFRLGGPRI